MSPEPFPVCTQCGFTWGEYRARGLLGCAHCYAAFGEALQADVAWLHHALAHSAPDPAATAVPGPEDLAGWREKLAEAVRREDYAEAARLRGLIQGPGPAEGSGPGIPGPAGQGPGLGLD